MKNSTVVWNTPFVKPKKSGYVLALVSYRDRATLLPYSSKYGLFNVSDTDAPQDALLYSFKPIAWAEIPIKTDIIE